MECTCYNCDITTNILYTFWPICFPLFLFSSYEIFFNCLKSNSVDLVLSCVDNYAARQTINTACTKLNQPWMESGVSEDAMNGHIQLMLPGRTACFQCIPPVAVSSGMDESQIRRNGACTASLPTTMGIIAGLLAQNTLKYLLGFGQISYYLGFNSLTNHFPTGILLPCKDCANPDCVSLQKHYAGKWKPQVWERKVVVVTAEEESTEEMEWGITYLYKHATVP